MFSNGTGVKHDLYPDVKNGDLNKPHSGYHGKVQNNEDYNIDYHNEDKSEKTSTSGSGCYLTSACLKHFKTKFDDNCKELSILRWFRDNYVPEEDIDYYYDIAPEIVNGINNNLYANDIYEYIYENVVLYCVEALQNGNYLDAYDRYKSSILSLEKQFVNKDKSKILST